MMRKKPLFLIVALMLAASVTHAGTGSDAPFSAGVTAGVATPVKGSGFFAGIRPSAGIDIAVRPLPFFGVGLEAFWSVNTSSWPAAVHSSTAFDHSYMGLYGSFDFLRLTRLPRRFGAGVEAGAGWGHRYNSGHVGDHNFFASRLGLFLNYDFAGCMSLVLRPGFLWNMSDAGVSNSSAAYSASRCAFMLQAGLRYRFGRPFATVARYDATQVGGLNSEINHLRARLDSIENVLDARPRVIREEAVDNGGGTVYDIFFHSGSDRVTADQMPNVERIAAHLNRNPATRVVIEGYASSDGAPDNNRQLAERRAREVARLLVERWQIEPRRITARGEGIGHLFAEESWNRVCVCTIKTATQTK